jgi:hypothetical protein
LDHASYYFLPLLIICLTAVFAAAFNAAVLLLWAAATCYAFYTGEEDLAKIWAMMVAVTGVVQFFCGGFVGDPGAAKRQVRRY